MRTGQAAGRMFAPTVLLAIFRIVKAKPPTGVNAALRRHRIVAAQAFLQVGVAVLFVMQHHIQRQPVPYPEGFAGYPTVIPKSAKVRFGKRSNSATFAV